jgi:hypothetical protein
MEIRKNPLCFMFPPNELNPEKKSYVTHCSISFFRVSFSEYPMIETRRRGCPMRSANATFNPGLFPENVVDVFEGLFEHWHLSAIS